MDELLARFRQGDQRALARLITLAENDESAAQEIVAALYASTGRAHIVGITGPPGSGKSTLVNALARAFDDEGRRTAVVAVDPSSPFSGGALLGDRVRMADLASNPAIFMRSMASRGMQGGLALPTAAVIKILDAGGYEIILVETVGAGQAEVDIAATAHTVVVVEAPGMGDEVQSIKAGILEIADVFVVNKADRPGVQRTVSALEMMLHMGRERSSGHHGRFAVDSQVEESGAEEWPVMVLQTVATEGRGIPELRQQIEAHHAYMRQSSAWMSREKRRSRQEIERIVEARLAGLLAQALSAEEREALVTAVAERSLSAYSAADEIMARIRPRPG